MASIHDYAAGALGGSAGLIVGHPFDTVKVQLQTHKHSSIIQCLKTVWKSGLGKNGFLRGLSFPLLSAGGLHALYFGVYGHSLRLLCERRGCSVDTPNLFDVAIAGGFGSLAQVIPACPVDVVKVNLQAQIKGSPSVVAEGVFNTGPVECTRNIIRNYGVRGLFRSLHVMTVRDTPAYMLYIVVYQSLKNLTLKHTSSRTLAECFSGGIAGVCSWLIIMPLDVIKSRLQADIGGLRYKGVIDCIAKSYKHDGGGIFLRGATAVTIRAFPCNAVIFFVYERALEIFEYLSPRKISYEPQIETFVKE